MIIIPTTVARNNRQEWKSILVSGHLGEGLLQLLGDRLVLLLLGDQLILQPVHLGNIAFKNIMKKWAPPSAVSAQTSQQTQRGPLPASAWSSGS